MSFVLGLVITDYALPVIDDLLTTPLPKKRAFHLGTMRFPFVHMFCRGCAHIDHHETSAMISHDVTEIFKTGKTGIPTDYLSGVSRRHLVPFDVIDSHGLKFGFHS